jgi:Ankyrin repeats (3 copies)
VSTTNPSSLELFAAEVPKAIFSCGLLDDEYCAECKKCPLVLPYYQYRVLRTPIDNLKKASRAFQVIIDTADLLCQKNDIVSGRDTRQIYIKSLCELALAFHPIGKWWDDDLWHDWGKNVYEDAPETHLFVAAVYTNSDSLVRQMIDPIAERPDSRIFSSVFGSAYSAASRQGNREILLLLLERLFDLSNEFSGWHISARSQAAMIAVQQGHLNAGSLFLSTDSHKLAHWRFWIPQEPGSYTREEFQCLFAILNTPNLDLFCRNMEFLQNATGEGTLPGDMLHRLVLEHSAGGNVEMVKHLMERPDFLPLRETIWPAIYSACRNNHIDIVKLLLYADTLPSDAMAPAAAGGHLDIVRMLATDDRFDINAGAGQYPPPIVSAVQLEHVPMFRFLRERGAMLDTPQSGGQAASIAKGGGLDSMLDILAEEGVGIDRVAPSPGGSYYRCKCRGCIPWGSLVSSSDEEFDEETDEEFDQESEESQEEDE